MYYKMIIAYDGTDYHGWQFQPELTTIAGVLQDRFFAVFKKPIKLLGASRTDAGVHALGQVARFKADFSIDKSLLKRAWNNLLPSSILIRDIIEAPEGYHPQHDVEEKVYYYHFFTSRPLPFYARYALFYKIPLDIDKLKEALQIFVGTHDFRSFCTGYDKPSTIRTINSIELVYVERYQVYRIIVKGRSFLHYMIRRIVGAALEIASHPEKDLCLLTKALESKHPHQHLPNAPAHGLMLSSIKYIAKNSNLS